MITEKTIAIYTAFAHKLPNARPELLATLLNYKNRVVVLGLEGQDIGESAFRELGIQYCSIPISRHKLSVKDEIHGSDIIARELITRKIDILLSYGVRLVPSANNAAKKANIPVMNIINGAGTLFVEGGVRGALLRKTIFPVLKKCFASSDKVVFQNNDDLDEFMSFKLVNRNQCGLTNGSGVNLQKYSLSDLPDEVIFCFVCRLAKEKGIGELVKAFQKLKLEFPNARLRIAGAMDGLEGTEIYSEFNDLVASHVIDYYGEITDIRGFLQGCCCFVFPSYREGCPRSIIEAMACGRPIITTDVPGCRETVQENENGYLVPSRNVELLYEAMKNMYRIGDERKSMGLVSRKIAEEKFDVNSNNRIICDYLQECLNHHEP